MLQMLFVGLSAGNRALVDDMGMGALYVSTSTDPTDAFITLTLRTDGTWDVTGAPATPEGTPLTGRWLKPGESASAWDVKYTQSGGSGSGTTVNDAAAFTQMSADRKIEMSKTTGGLFARSILVEIAATGSGTTQLSETTSLTAEVEV